MNDSGSASVEFAMVSGAFLLLLFGIMAVGLVFVGHTSLENAAERGARLIRTGQAQGLNGASFKTEVCNYLTPPLSCAGLQLDVSNNLAPDSCGTATSYNPGTTGDLIIVRAFYDWTLLNNLPILPLWNGVTVDTRLRTPCATGHLLMATVAFRNEVTQ